MSGIEEHKGLVVTVALRYAQAYGYEMDDLMQEAWVGVIKGLRTYDPDRAALSTHLWHQARREVWGWIRRQMRGEGALSMDEELGEDGDTFDLHDVIPDPNAVDMDHAALLAQLRQWVSLLPHDLRVACDMSRTHAEIAEAEGCRPRQVEYRRQLAFRWIREAMGVELG